MKKWIIRATIFLLAVATGIGIAKHSSASVYQNKKISKLPPGKQKAIDDEKANKLKGKMNEKKKNISITKQKAASKGPLIKSKGPKVKTHEVKHIDIQDPTEQTYVKFTNGWAIVDTKNQIKGASGGVIEAGALKSDPKQGVLMLRYWSNNMQGKLVKTPTKQGSVKVIKQNGMNVVIQATSGTKWRFNFLTKKFKLIK